jgi:nicotinate-nucleotide adenylyltransferase
MSSTAPPKPSQVSKPLPAPLGILGGTFDPIHVAHLRLAEEATRQLGLAGIVWIPAGNPWHRSAPMVSGQHRLAMVRLAIADHPDHMVDDAEVHSPAPSYTVPTLERLRRQHGADRPLVLLMGADAFLGLTTWHRWRDLFRLAHLGVASRPTFDLVPERMPLELADEFRRRRAVGGAGGRRRRRDHLFPPRGGHGIGHRSAPPAPPVDATGRAAGRIAAAGRSRLYSPTPAIPSLTCRPPSSRKSPSPPSKTSRARTSRSSTPPS